MLAALLAAAAVVRLRAADELAADVALLEAVLDHERRVEPVDWVADDRAPTLEHDDGTHEKQYPVFNNDAEAAEFFNEKGLFIKSPEEIEEPPWTGNNDPLHVIFSFGAANGGYDNVVEVADQFKKSYHLNSYIDSNYLPSQAGSYRISGNDYPRNVNWKAWYARAMLDAPTMIFLVTPEWIRSEFCKEELAWAVERRVGSRFLNIILTSPGLLDDPSRGTTHAS